MPLNSYKEISTYNEPESNVSLKFWESFHEVVMDPEIYDCKPSIGIPNIKETIPLE